MLYPRAHYKYRTSGEYRSKPGGEVNLTYLINAPTYVDVIVINISN